VFGGLIKMTVVKENGAQDPALSFARFRQSAFNFL